MLSPDVPSIVDVSLSLLRTVLRERDREQDIRRIEADMAQIQAKKDRLLELELQGAITVEEFKQRNDAFNAHRAALAEKLSALRAGAGGGAAEDFIKIRSALEGALTFREGTDSALAAAILDRAVVKRESTKETLHLDLYLKFGGPWRAVFDRSDGSFRFIPFLTDTAKGREL